MHLQELLYYNSSKDYVKGKLCYYFNILSQAILPPYRAILDNIYLEHFNEPGFDRVAQLNFPFHERVFETDVETGEESGSGRVNLETAEDQRLAAEEYVASIAESGAPKPNWWKEFLQSVRMWIADHFPHARQVRMTDREIETLLARSARAARRNRRGEGKVIAPEEARFAAALRRQGAPNTAGERNQLRDSNVPHSAGFMETNKLTGKGLYADYEFLYGRHPEYFSSPEEARAVVEFVLDDPEPAGRINANLAFVRQDSVTGKIYRIEINPKVSGNRNQIRSAHEITEAQYKKRENRLTRDDNAASPDSVRQGENAKTSEHPNMKNPDSRKAGSVSDFLRNNITSSGEKSSGNTGIKFAVNENGETVFGIAGRDGDFTAREIMEDKTISENTPILTSDGSEVWGEITPEMAEAGKELGLEALPIRLMKGIHRGPHQGFGLEHLWNQHGAELEARGYDLSDFLTRIFGKPYQIYASKQGDNIRLELVTNSKPRNVGVLELRKEDGFYSVVTAFPIDLEYYKLKGKLVWRYTASKPNMISQDGSSVISAGKQRTSPLDPLSADDAADAARDSRSKPDINITSSGEKSSGNTGAVYSVDSVWTGSAASYDAPSLQYIGTGEGQQVFGWGLYGSSSREVAEWYAKADVARKRNPAQNDLVVYLDGKKLNDPNSDKDVSDLVWFVFHFGETYVREFAEQNAKLSYSGLEEYSRMRDANPEMRNESGKNQERDEKSLKILDRIKIEENEDPLIWDAVSGLSSARMKPSERHSAADIEQRLRSDLRNVLERRRKSYQDLASKNKNVRIREINQRKADAYERAIAKLPSLSWEELTTGGLPHNLYQQTFWPGKEENLLDWYTERTGMRSRE